MRTFTLGAGKDTVVFESTPGTNGQDVITNFTAGANGDKLAVGGTSGLLGEEFAPAKFTTASGAINLTSKQVLIHTGSTAIDPTAGSNNTSFKTSSGTNYQISTSQKLFVVDTVNNANILYLVDEGSNSLTVTKVGTLNAGSAITLTADNFGDVA